ncbi:type VI secretion system lipoprotein TssJ [Caballeronia sordidicola]|uniref:type VI secretion system lipoprotein TssJ n=1 Tax=Caballeronia sordidicola TaxID=196367 RepID=UPI000AB6D9C5|nr:type VI secretion system lipoprotein TssJ [Caballeronia sordidicola]
MNPMMIRLIHQTRLAAAVCAILTIAGCGIAQSVKTGTVDAAKWAFTTQIKTMNLDLMSRSSLNTSGAGRSLSTVLRVYQLKTPQAFEQLGYAQLQGNDLDALKPDLLGTTDVVLRPNASASLSEPMDEQARFVAIVAFFRDEGRESTWRLLIPKKQWKATDPVKVEVRDNTLQLAGTNANAVKRYTSQPGATQPDTPKATKPSAKGTALKDDWLQPG